MLFSEKRKKQDNRHDSRPFISQWHFHQKAQLRKVLQNYRATSIIFRKVVGFDVVFFFSSKVCIVCGFVMHFPRGALRMMRGDGDCACFSAIRKMKAPVSAPVLWESILLLSPMSREFILITNPYYPLWSESVSYPHMWQTVLHTEMGVHCRMCVMWELGVWGGFQQITDRWKERKIPLTNTCSEF